MAAPATKWLRELGRRNLDLLRHATPFATSTRQCDRHRPPVFQLDSATARDRPSSVYVFSPAVAAAVGTPSSFPHRQAFLRGNVLSVASFSRMAPNPSKPSTSVGESSKIDPGRPDDKKQTEEKSLGSRIKDLISALDKVPAAPLGLGLGGAIPFVSLTPGIASILPLPDALFAMHIEAQAAYGAVILTFLGGPYWGIAMAGGDWTQSSKFSKQTIQNLRYIWSVIPSLVAWPALLLNPVPKFAVLITSYLVALGVDATFARNGLLPSWYMPMRYLLTGIATLSMTSSLIVTAAGNVITH